MHHAPFPFTSSETDLIARWPGKSPIVEGGPAHPAVYHMLDVAAAAEQLIAPFGLPPQQRDALVFLVALHDIGKVGNEFRAMLQTGAPQSRRHWEVSEAFLLDEEDWLAERLELLSARHSSACRRRCRAPRSATIGNCRSLGADARKRRRGGAGRRCHDHEDFAELWPGASLGGLTAAKRSG